MVEPLLFSIFLSLGNGLKWIKFKFEDVIFWFWSFFFNHRKKLVFCFEVRPLKKNYVCLQCTLLYWTKKRAPKPLLGCQNWITSMDGCQKLVPGWHSQRRSGGGVVCHINIINIKRHKLRIKKLSLSLFLSFCSLVNRPVFIFAFSEFN